LKFNLQVDVYNADAFNLFLSLIYQ
jgi:hypothetical protein